MSSEQEFVMPQSTACKAIKTPMKQIWTNNCPNRFKACTFWDQADCSGAKIRSNIDEGTCYGAPWLIKAMSCEL
jgi:hypothetical protein